MNLVAIEQRLVPLCVFDQSPSLNTRVLFLGTNSTKMLLYQGTALF